MAFLVPYCIVTEWRCKWSESR